MTRATLRTEAQRQLAEPSSGGYWSDTDYNNAANRAQENFAIRTKCLKTYAYFTTSAATHEYDMTESSLANLLDLAEVRFYTSTTDYDVLVPCTRDELQHNQANRTGVTGTPIYYCYEDRVIEFDCDTEASKTVRVYYYKLPTDMDEDTDVSTIPTKFHQTLVDFMCWKFAESDELDVERTAYFKRLYEEGVNNAIMVLRPAGTTYGGIKDDTELGSYA